MNKKAIVFTLDGILAVLFVSATILSSFFYLSKANVSYGEPYLYEISKDILAVLEKSATLENAVAASDITNVENYMDSLPNQICGTITIYDKDSASLLSATRTACTAGNKQTIARRSFIYNFESYYAEMIAWYK